VSFAPGMWGAYYDTGLMQVNDALNATIGGTWYVVFGSAVAMALSSVVNSGTNVLVARALGTDTFGTFAARSYLSTLVGQFCDNFIFASIVSHTFFGWTWTQVVMCSLTGAAAELVGEVVLSPLAYKAVCGWEREHVGEGYLARHGMLDDGDKPDAEKGPNASGTSGGPDNNPLPNGAR